jgi:hypothetical protein
VGDGDIDGKYEMMYHDYSKKWWWLMMIMVSDYDDVDDNYDDNNYNNFSYSDYDDNYIISLTLAISNRLLHEPSSYLKRMYFDAISYNTSR